MEKLRKCDVCEWREKDKDTMPCKVCSDNKNFVSHFKEDKIVSFLREAWDIKDAAV